jgi:phage/plasmid-associated DNA primase
MQNQFSFQHLKTLNLDNGKEYIKQFFIPLTNGNHVFVKGPKFEILDTPTLKKVYFNRIHKDLNKFYFTEHDDVREPVCAIGQPFLFEDKVNLSGTFKHQTKPYNEYSEEVKTKVERVISVIREVWANNNKKTLKYILGWFAKMMKGIKTQKILYLKGPQGIGKSTITEFMVNNVMGKLAYVSGSEPLKSQFNISLMGKLLVVFEELENFGTNEWTVISSRLKRFSTAAETPYEAKGKDIITAPDINNYIVLSNNDAVKDDDGRRYVILDLSLKYKGQVDFWSKLHKECLNDVVGEAFYNYLLEYDLTDFDLEKPPQTQSKSDAIVKRMDLVARFIKESFVLPKKDIKISVPDMFDLFVSFCSNNNAKHCHKIDFNKKMAEYGMTYYKSNSKLMYKINHDDLLVIANKNKWLHELDEFEDDDDVEVMANLEHGIQNDNVDITKQLKKENAELKKRIAALEQRPKQQPVPTIDFTQSPAYLKMLKIIKKLDKPTVKELVLDFDGDDDDVFSDSDDEYIDGEEDIFNL